MTHHPARPKRLLFTSTEAAEMLGIGSKTLRAHCLAGEIGFVITGKRTRKFTVGDIDEFIKNQSYAPYSALRAKTARISAAPSRSREYDFMAAHAKRKKQKRR